MCAEENSCDQEFDLKGSENESENKNDLIEEGTEQMHSIPINRYVSHSKLNPQYKCFINFLTSFYYSQECC